MRKEVVEKQTMRAVTHPSFSPPAMAALLAGCWLLVAIGRSDDMLPKGFDVSRYQAIWERNPFTLVTPSLAQAPASPFSKLILVNWLHDKGKDILFVQDTETNEVKKVTKEAGANSDQLRLIEVVPNKNPRLIVAKLSNGREEGVVKFKFDQAQNGQAVNPNFMQRGVPSQGPMGPNGQQLGVNQPGGPLRRTPQVPGNQPNPQQNPANAPNAQEIRRRRMLPTPAQDQVPPQNQVRPQNQVSENPVLQNNAVQSNGQQNNNGAADPDDDDQ